jgi:hypothetical protein
VTRDASDEHGLPLWPAPERNKQPIADVLKTVLPAHGLLLEIASGTGQHALHFAAELPGWTLQPSDCEPEHLETLRRRVALAQHPRVLAPLVLDVTAEPPACAPAAIFCANMLHIAPWQACAGLFDVAARLLPPAGPLVTYGPYAVAGRHSAESNARFDASLRERNPDWGVRDLDAVREVARARGFTLETTHAMPANNLLLVWRRPANPERRSS